MHAKRRDGADTSGSPLAYPQSSFYYCRGVHWGRARATSRRWPGDYWGYGGCRHTM